MSGLFGGSPEDFITLLRRYSEVTGSPFFEVLREYSVLLRPPPADLGGCLRYCGSLARLFGVLAKACEGGPVFEGKRNQRKLLVLRYFSERGSATSFEVSLDLKMSLTNASERLRRYYKQGLLARTALVRRGRGRPTMVYELTEVGRGRLAFLEKTVKFRKAETYWSKEYRSRQLMFERIVGALGVRLYLDSLSR